MLGLSYSKLISLVRLIQLIRSPVYHITSVFYPTNTCASSYQLHSNVALATKLFLFARQYESNFQADAVFRNFPFVHDDFLVLYPSALNISNGL